MPNTSSSISRRNVDNIETATKNSGKDILCAQLSLLPSLRMVELDTKIKVAVILSRYRGAFDSLSDSVCCSFIKPTDSSNPIHSCCDIHAVSEFWQYLPEWAVYTCSRGVTFLDRISSTGFLETMFDKSAWISKYRVRCVKFSSKRPTAQPLSIGVPSSPTDIPTPIRTRISAKLARVIAFATLRCDNLSTALPRLVCLSGILALRVTSLFCWAERACL
mmetsp:Transcript_9611/g.15748  ORF Transcript_9611/g.15748 Transcript_9611/m.15748 type:complete len:219 (+) Transcript_9611:429-1085(+)